MGFITIDPAIDPRPAPLRHNPFNALVAPRPIGWVTTLSAGGLINLAPYSYFNAVTGDPPCVMFCGNGAHPEDGGVKDSLRNVEETGEFVCNIVSWELREQMNATSAHVARTVDEMREAGLEPIASVKVRPPRVALAPAHLECRHVETVRLPSRGEPGNRMVIGQVVAMHIDERAIADGRVDYLKFKAVARLGYMDYCAVDNVFEMLRPD